MTSETQTHADLFQLTGVGVVETDLASGRFVRVNRTFCELVGYGEAELLGMTYLELTHPDDRARDAASFAALGQGELEEAQALTRVLHKNGQTLWLALHVTVLGEGGAAVNLTVATDVTERVRAEEALRRAAEGDAFRVALNDALSSLSDPLAVQEEAARVLAEHLQADGVHYTEIDETQTLYRVTRDFSRGDVPSMVGTYPLAAFSWLGPNFLAGGRIVVADAQASPLIPEADRAAVAAIGVRALVTVPLIKGGRFVAALSAVSATPRDWTPEEVELISETAERTWAALERARAEEALRASEERFRLMVDSVPISIWITDAGGQVEFLNKHWADYSGMSSLPATAADVAAAAIHPDDVPVVLAAFGDAMRTSSTFEVEQRNRSAAGEYRWFLNRGSPYRDPATGEVAAWFGVSIDVHNRKRAEAAVRESGERLRLTVESVKDYAIFTLDPERRVTSWNSGAERLFGYSAADAVGTSGDLLFTPEDRAAGVPEQEARTAREQGRADDDRWHLREDGTRFFASGVVTPLRDGERLLGYVKVARDLTEQREAELERERLLAQLKELNETLEQRVQKRTEELAFSERRFSQAFYTNPIPACMTTFGHETFVEVNDALLDLTGYKRGEVVGHTSHELSMWSSGEDQQRLDEAQRDGKGFRNLELRLLTKDGTVKNIVMSAEVIRLDGDEGYLKMFYDVTERKRTEEEMHKAVQAVMNDALWFSRELIEQLTRIRTGGKALPSVELSRRERQVLGLMAGGLGNEAIAQELELRPQTIRNYVATIYDKLGVNTRAEAIVWARERAITGQ